MREVPKMANLVGELFLLRDYRTAFRQVFERIDRLDKSAKPPFCGFRFLVILIPFQDETNNATLSSWQDHEEPMSSWSHPLGRLCSKPRTSGNSGKPWRCCSQRS